MLQFYSLMSIYHLSLTKGRNYLLLKLWGSFDLFKDNAEQEIK